MPFGKLKEMISTVLSFVAVLRMASANIVASPKDVEAPTGATVVFNCSSSIAGADVQWNVHPVGKPMQVIYAYSKINPPYVSRFTIQNGHNLHISSVTVGDAGTYECRDDYGRGEKISTELIILGSNLTCQCNNNSGSVTKKTQGASEVHRTTLTCSVQYQGKRFPTLEWKKYGYETAITSGVTSEIRGDVLLYNLTIEDVPKNVNGSSYNCRWAKAGMKSATCTPICNDATGQSSSPPDSDSSQSQVVVVVVIMILFIIIFNAIAASVVWYLFIRPFTQKKISKEQTKFDAESTTLLNKEPHAKTENELVTPTKEENAKAHVSTENESGTATNSEQQSKTDDNPTTPLNQKQQDATTSELQISSNQKGQRSPCKCSKDAIIFVLLMAIPFGIGLLLWYLFVYRKAVKKSDKGKKNDNELATFLNRPRKMKEMQETVNGLESDKQSLENDNTNLKKDMQSLENDNTNLKKDMQSLENDNTNLLNENGGVHARNHILLMEIERLKKAIDELRNQSVISHMFSKRQ